MANKRAQEFIQEKEREAAGIIEPKLMREAAQRSLVEHLNDYEADLVARGRAGRGGRGARLLKSRITRLLTDNRWQRPADITADSFINWRKRQTDGARTQNHYLQGAISFLNWLERAGRIKFNPLKNVGKVDERGKKKRVRRAFTDEELRKLIAGSGPRGIIYFTAARTGLRWEELRQLTWGDVRLNEQTPQLCVRAETTKNKKADTIPLTTFAAATRRLPLSTLGMLQYIGPVLQFIVAVVIVHEPMSPSRWSGFALIWIALAVVTFDALRHNHLNVRRRRAELESTAA